MKNRILRSALSVALCAAMLLSQGLTAFADGEIDLAAAKSSPVQESSEESEAKTPAETLTPETKKELPASTEDETKTETTTGQPTAEDDTAKETTAKTPAVVSEEEKSEEATAAPAEAQAATNSLKSNWGNGCPEEKTPEHRDIKKILTVKIHCRSVPGFFVGHDTIWEYDSDYVNISNKYDFKNGGYAVTLNCKGIGDDYDFMPFYDHHFDSATASYKGGSATFYVKWNGRYWTIDGERNKTITISVHCKGGGCEPGDDIPDPNEQISTIFSDLLYQIDCVKDDNVDNIHSMDEAAQIPFDAISIPSWKEGETSATAIVDLSTIVDECYTGKVKHTLCANQEDVEIPLTYEDGNWSAKLPEGPIEIEIECETEPTKPVTPSIPIKPVDDEIAKRLEVTVICDNPFHTSQDAIYTFYNDRYFTVSEVVGNVEEGAFFTVEINPQQYFEVYEKLCGTLYGEHHLVTEKVDPITFTWNNKEKTWDIKDAEVPVEIHVICEAELPSIDPSVPGSILEKIWVDMNCTEDDKHDTLKYTNLASVSPLDYSIEYNKDEGTATVSLLNLDEWVRLYDVQDKVKHTFTVSNPPTIGLKYNSENGWQLEDESKNTFVIEIACDAFDKDNFISFIEQSVKVQIECVNENRLHDSETITWPLEEGSYSRGYWKIDDVVVNEQGGYTATITVDPSYCLDDYNKDNGEHYLVLHNSILSLAFNFNAASETWEPVEQHDFYLPVTCNVPAVPTYKDLEELLGNMTVYCVNENHLVSKAYPITWNTIGGLNQKPVQNDDGTFSMEITVSYDPFKDLFDDEFGPHDYVENIELARSVVSLKWSKDVGTWIVDGSFINSFNVICDTTSGNPGGGDNGNNGGNNNGGSTGGGSSVSRRDDDDDWEPLPNNNYRVTKKNDKPSQNTQIVVRDPADNSDNTSSNTGSDSGKHNPETGDTTTVFAAMALAAVSLGGVVLLGRKKK